MKLHSKNLGKIIEDDADSNQSKSKLLEKLSTPEVIKGKTEGAAKKSSQMTDEEKELLETVSKGFKVPWGELNVWKFKEKIDK